VKQICSVNREKESTTELRDVRRIWQIKKQHLQNHIGLKSAASQGFTSGQVLTRSEALTNAIFLTHFPLFDEFEKALLVGVAYRYPFIADFDHLSFDIFNFIDSHKIRFMYTAKAGFV
jgi:hypothetical protein